MKYLMMLLALSCVACSPAKDPDSHADKAVVASHADTVPPRSQISDTA